MVGRRPEVVKWIWIICGLCTHNDESEIEKDSRDGPRVEATTQKLEIVCVRGRRPITMIHAGSFVSSINPAILLVFFLSFRKSGSELRL
jgi:hypothetical protein